MRCGRGGTVIDDPYAATEHLWSGPYAEITLDRKALREFLHERCPACGYHAHRTNIEASVEAYKKKKMARTDAMEKALRNLYKNVEGIMDTCPEWADEMGVANRQTLEHWCAEARAALGEEGE